MIASFADHSNSDNPDSTLPANIQKQKEAKKVIEADRLQFCRQRGYNAALLQLTSVGHRRNLSMLMCDEGGSAGGTTPLQSMWRRGLQYKS